MTGWESWQPEWPLPKIFRMTKDGKLIEGIFEGATINTPSMLCVEDFLYSLSWGKSQGGLRGLVVKTPKPTPRSLKDLWQKTIG